LNNCDKKQTNNRIYFNHFALTDSLELLRMVLEYNTLLLQLCCNFETIWKQSSRQVNYYYRKRHY